MKNKNIDFKINKGLDIGKFKTFYFRKNKVGPDFKETLERIHPKLKDISHASKKETENGIEEYVGSIYEKHSKDFLEITKKMKKDWKKVETQFFDLTGKYFNDLK